MTATAAGASFFDTFTDTSAGNWVKADEKNELMENGQTFVITSVSRDEHSQFGERYVAHVILSDEERAMSFPVGTVESRDRMLEALEKWLDDPANEKPVCKLEKVGRSIIIRPAS